MNSKDNSEHEKELINDINDIQNFDIEKFNKDTERMEIITSSELERFIDKLYEDGESEIEKTKKKRNFNESFIGKLLKFIFS